MSDGRRRVARGLVSEIAEGRARAGDRLPTAQELADRFGVTPRVACDALRDLEARGMAKVDPHGGATICPEAQWDVLNRDLLDALLGSKHGPTILAEYLEYRRVVEVAAAGLAAEHATARDLTTLSNSLATMAAAAKEATVSEDAEARFHRADVAFHQALIAASRNRPLELATDALRPALCTARRQLARPRLREERAIPEHQRILAAVAQGDAEAAREAMTAHLDTVESYLREYAGLPGCASQPNGRPDER
jgi:DNA-binding FadR family transcriptional regulator